MTELEREMREALKALLWQHDNNDGILCGMALQAARAAVARFDWAYGFNESAISKRSDD